MNDITEIEQFIIFNHDRLSLNDLAYKVKIEAICVCAILRKNGLKIISKAPKFNRTNVIAFNAPRKIRVMAWKGNTPKLEVPQIAPWNPNERPPAIYSNSPSPYGIADEFHNLKLNYYK